MFSRIELGPVRFPSGIAHISDPSIISNTKAAEKSLKAEASDQTRSFFAVDATPSFMPGINQAKTAGLRVPDTQGTAYLILDGSERPFAFTIHFAQSERMIAAKAVMQGFVEIENGQLMAADLDAVLNDYSERHVRFESEETMGFSYDLVCLNSARNNKLGATFRGYAAVIEVPTGNAATFTAPIMAMIDNEETVGLFISLNR